MTIREANDQDIPDILKVLKASLGESSSKKTEAVWRYKHIDNPFGRSLVLVAVEEDKIIGVRAFMRWKWQKGNEVFSAFRAVDTATHPEHQGKGIFKKLTLKALEVAKSNGDHFVFNTPNEQSKPGYLKMGWEEVAKLKVGIKPVNPFHWKKTATHTELPLEIQCSEESIEFLTKELNLELARSCNFFTPKSRKYLTWRYENNPMQEYIINATDKFYLAGYVKQHSKFTELRIVEKIINSPGDSKLVNSSIKRWAKEFGVQIISFAPNNRFKSGSGVSGKFGPVLTVRDINLLEKNRKDILILDNWTYSLGDLELF